VTGPECVVFAFVPAEEPGHPTLLAERGESIPPTGEYLVSVRLVPDIPDDLVFRGLEDTMEADRQFHGAQAGAQVTTSLGDTLDQKLADFQRQLVELTNRATPQVCRLGNAVKHRGCGLPRLFA
jgi:hypothetical protein